MRHEGALAASPNGTAPAALPAFPSLLRLSIAHRVFLVGAISTAVAVIIGVAALFLLNQADEARKGALDVSTVYRHVVSAMSARDAYVDSNLADRSRSLSAFSASLSGASAGLDSLNRRTDDADDAAAILATITSLERYRQAMGELTIATEKNDRLLAEMEERLASLILLTDEARQRQHAANVDVVKTLTDRDATLRATQDIVDNAQAVRAAVADVALARSRGPEGTGAGTVGVFEVARLENAGRDLTEALQRADKDEDAADFVEIFSGISNNAAPEETLAWIDRRLKIETTAQRALHLEVAELLTYTVEAHETEQATQNIAIATLKLGQSLRAAISRRDSAGIEAVVAESRQLGEEIASLPISPLIQTEMLDALDLWRDGLIAARDGLAAQNATLARMNENAGIMIFEVSSLNSALSSNADRIGSAARSILLFGAGLGLLVASVTGLLVARSIAVPLKRLEHGMIGRAAHPSSGPLGDWDRSDEIGSMARATNYFLSELGKREGALRAAKDRTEATLRQLRKTQGELIQAEKLASLGQLVAGVAHEINTPLGVALTTATVMGDETRRFESDTRDGRVTREAFDQFVARMSEGARLMAANLERSANLVHSFKQVATDQASGERRHFQMTAFANDLFTSLGPMGKRAGHRIDIACEAGIEMDSYPGALAQVLTNLLANAYSHAFEEGRPGTVRVAIARLGADRVRLTFSDDGKGIAPENRRRIFDPFFTTGRARGSTGLGLHIVFNLVTATLGGTIDIESEVGQGTRFIVDLPIVRAEPAAAVAPLERV